jgi:hypothetical protein
MRPDSPTLIAAKRLSLYLDAVLDDVTTGVIDVAPAEFDADNDVTAMEVLHELTLGDLQRVVNYVLTAAHQ